MTYEAILNELNEVHLKNQFQSLFEKLIQPELLGKVKTEKRLFSTAAALRYLLSMIEDETSEEYVFWLKVLHYFMTPKFARTQKQLIEISAVEFMKVVNVKANETKKLLTKSFFSKDKTYYYDILSKFPTMPVSGDAYEDINNLAAKYAQSLDY